MISTRYPEKMSDEVEVKSELYLGDPPEDLLKWAKDNIREDPDTKYEILNEFRDLIYSRGECTPHRTDDAFLLRFLRGRHFSLEATYRLFVNYYDFKEENQDYYHGVQLSHLKRIGDQDIINVPPYKDQAGRRMMLYKLGKWDPQFFSVDDVFKATMLILEMAILEPTAQILGGIAIFDFGGLTMQQVMYMNPGIAQKMVQIMVTSFPMKIQALHIVNQSWLFDIAFNIFKPFLHERMKERIFFHGSDMESLHKHVDRKCLPEIYGGIHPHYDYNDWIEGFRRNKTILKELESLGYGTD